MTAPLAKVDATLLSRLAPWLELLAPKAPAGAGQAQPVVSTPRVANDLLLPTRADLHPQDVATAPRMPSLAGVHASGGTELSAAARAIVALLADRQQGDAGPVRGSAAAWADADQMPVAAKVASALSRQVSESGLFYESHLAQFAAGARNLAQMEQEPQARLASPGAASAPQSQDQRAGVLPLVSAPAPAAAVLAALPGTVVAMAGSNSLMAPANQALDAPLPDALQPAAQDAEGAAMPMQQMEPAHRVAQQIFSPLGDMAQLRSADAAPAADRQVAQTAAPAPDAQPAATLIHPSASAIVHQQLDLLATSVFRWSGEAWPGVPMQWEVQEDEEGGRRHEEEAASQPQWSTTVSLSLPHLGQLDVRLRLIGSEVRAQLVAKRDETVEQLRAHRAALSRRMSAAGLELSSLQVDTELAAS